MRSQTAIFVDFTADWCLSCKVNEKLFLNHSEIVALTQKKKVVLMKADWTSYDETITRWLKKYRRAGVPFYLLLLPDGREVEFPEVLSLDLLKTHLGPLPDRSPADHPE